MRRVIATLALALLVLGCSAPKGDPVELLTASSGCYLGGEHAVEDELLADPEYGTRFHGRPVTWPLGFTGVRLVGGQVVVLNKGGYVVAKTGNKYGIAFAYAEEEARRLEETIGAFTAAVNCPYPHDFYEVH